MASTRAASAQVLVILSFILNVSSHPAWRHSYAKTCPKAGEIVRDTIEDHSRRDPTILGALIRLHFHDCFVNGCDASILLDSTPTDGTNVEKFAAPNNNSLRGYEVIEDAKRRLENACPGVVSCADAIAIAARDSTVKVGGRYYEVPTGRYDGRISSQQLANTFLPSPGSNASALIRSFRRQGLSPQDLVVLSGAHTLGTSKCAFFSSSPFDRVYNFQNTSRPDRTVNPAFLERLQKQCPPGSSNAVQLDNSQFAFDNSYYGNLEKRKGLLTSDQQLFESQRTRGLVKSYACNAEQFAAHFGPSMVKMGNIEWKTNGNGEIRRVCNAVNVNRHNSE